MTDTGNRRAGVALRPPDGSGEAKSSVEKCLFEVRNMIMNGELLPGEKVHQVDLAQRLDVSRIPLREALSTLAAEGILTHRRNSGYQVARFSSNDLSEIYLMRRLLETELMRTATLGPDLAKELTVVNEQIRVTDPSTHPNLYQDLNQRFHFLIFERSPLRLVQEDVARLWYRSSFYRSLYLHEATTALRVVTEHEAIIEAVRADDVETLIALSDDHREGTEQLATQRLGRSRPG